MGKYKLISIFIGGVVCGVLIMYLINVPSTVSSREVRQGGYSLINPLLECEMGLTSSKELSDLEVSLKERIEQLLANNKAQNISVYLRDLNNGPTIGIHEDIEFSPASLLKIPIMIAYYNEAESNPQLLEKKITLDVSNDYNEMESIRTSEYLERGKEYTINQLLEAMVVSSDNNALAKLTTELSEEKQSEVYRDLGITIPGVRGIENFMTVKEYASFFRILYNASYLTPEYSEKALQMLTKPDYEGGLRGALPSSFMLANKFGEREFNGVKQLHDCGILYFEDRPYLLCIMTRGGSFSSLDESIQELTKLVYSTLEKQD